jgi:transcription factor E
MSTKKKKNILENKNKLQDLLKEVVSIVAGKPSEDIVGILNTRKHVNEFLIAKKLDITINQTRNILYKISDHGLVSNIRKKDKKKGWYTYFWKIEILKSLEFLQSHLTKRMSQIQNQIKSRNTKRYYICERCNIELGEENALLHDFICQECGALFNLKDNAKILRDLGRNVSKLDKELEAVEFEVLKEQAKLDKEKENMIKKAKKEASEKRKKALAKRRATKALKDKASKKVSDTLKGTRKKPKKKVKKKVKKKTLNTLKGTRKKLLKKSSKKKVFKKPVKKSIKKVSKKIFKKKIKKKIIKKKISKNKKIAKKKK